MAKRIAMPTIWTSEQLQDDYSSAIERFVSARLGAGDGFYTEKFAESLELAKRFMTTTKNLTNLDWEPFLDQPELLEDIGRFIAGPPISADDFKTIRGFKSIKKGNASQTRESMFLIGKKLDSTRFPWVNESRPPESTEIQSALVATASLRAVERTRTEQRASQKARQEGGVASYLRQLPLQEVDRVLDPDEDMDPGSFKGGVAFEAKQCDVLVRLFDGRFLALECKSTNSAVNSIKRLNDISDKEKVWKRARGAKVVTAGVLAGVFDLGSLEKAQVNDIYLFWEHNLDALGEFVLSTR